MNSEKRLEKVTAKEILLLFFEWLFCMAAFIVGNIPFAILAIGIGVFYPLHVVCFWVVLSFLMFIIDLKDKKIIMKYVS